MLGNTLSRDDFPWQIPLCMAMLDGNGTLIGSNTDWENHADETGCWRGRTSRGVDYLSILGQSPNECARKARIGVESLLAGRDSHVAFYYSAWCRDRERRFQFSATSVRENDRIVVVITVSQTAPASSFENLGIITGGAASDFKEWAVAVSQNARSLLKCLSATDERRPLVIAVSQSCQKVIRLANKLLSYAGRRPRQLEPVELNTVVRDVAEMIKASVPEQAKLEIDLDETIPRALGDGAQIQSMLMNLIMNGAEAIVDTGTVTVKTRSRHVDREFTRDLKLTQPIPGDHVLLEVHDDGPEMDDRALAEAMGPHGFTGLRRLAVAAIAATIRGHGGALGIRSAPGRGTSFILFFQPASEEDGGK
jgi:signal transduction histidine kinase